ncbi:putative membrane protein [Gelidibacter algens]|uniref:Putative membrane protein n=2 Tax=Gelidibacter algens TaxID=49280 RepID=A0A327SG48_9FLAO|nr:putative membrane protein [Gelidibacter algens]
MLITSMALSIIILALRMKLNHSFFFLFLIWNLILALIPYLITTYLSSKAHINKWILGFGFCVWLLFLPNAPYILTDLLHLNALESRCIWLDVLVITSFACNGILLFYLSIFDMEVLLKRVLNDRILKYVLLSLFPLTSFGMYLGRFLRYNSWEILQNPFALFADIFDILVHPTDHLQAWVFTLTFAAFLGVGYWIFKGFNTVEN